MSNTPADEVSDVLVLAAIDRAERHREEQEERPDMGSARSSPYRVAHEACPPRPGAAGGAGDLGVAGALAPSQRHGVGDDEQGSSAAVAGA